MTNAGLTSINGIAGFTNNQLLIWINKTGNVVTVKHNSAVTPANGILTPLGVNIDVPDGGDLFMAYVQSLARWLVIGGSGGGGSSGSKFYAVQNIASGGQIALGAEKDQVLKVQGNGGAQTASTTPFSGTPTDGMSIVLLGQDSTKPLLIVHNDSNGGCINPNGGDVYLNKYSTITYVYDLSAQRYIGKAGNNI